MSNVNNWVTESIFLIILTADLGWFEKKLFHSLNVHKVLKVDGLQKTGFSKNLFASQMFIFASAYHKHCYGSISKAKKLTA